MTPNNPVEATRETRPTMPGLSEGLFLAAASGLGYAYAFFFLRGFWDRFGVSWWLIDVPLGAIVICGMLSIVGCYIGLSLLMLIPHGPLWWSLASALAMAVLYGGFAAILAVWGLSPWSFAAALVWIGACAIILAKKGTALRAALQGPGEKGSKWIASAVEFTGVVPAERTALAVLLADLKRRGVPTFSWVIGLGILTIVVPIAFSKAGEVASARRHSFPVVDRTPPCVLLGHSNSRWLCAELDSSRRKFTGSVALLTDADAIVFSRSDSVAPPR